MNKKQYLVGNIATAACSVLQLLILSNIANSAEYYIVMISQATTFLLGSTIFILLFIETRAQHRITYSVCVALTAVFYLLLAGGNRVASSCTVGLGVVLCVAAFFYTSNKEKQSELTNHD